MTPDRKAEIVAEIVEVFRVNGYTPVTGKYMDSGCGRCAVGAVTGTPSLDRNLQFARRFNVGDGVIFGVIHGFDALSLEECIDDEERDGYEIGSAVRAALEGGGK